MSRNGMPESEAGSTSQSPPQSPGTSGTKRKNSKSSKPRLTAVQKNTNHKDAENKRRTAIRERFTELSELVPDAHGQERSEQVMLTKTKEYLEDSMTEIRQLEEYARLHGLPDNGAGKLKDTDFGGPTWKQPNMDKYQKAKLKKASKGGDIQDDADCEVDEEG